MVLSLRWSVALALVVAEIFDEPLCQTMSLGPSNLCINFEVPTVSRS